MNKNKKEQKRKKRGLLTHAEHMENRAERMLKGWAKNPKNKGKSPFK